MRIIIMLFLFLPSVSLAGKSGFIKNGSEIILYKNGKSVKKNRKLATEANLQNAIFFEEDKLARCYFIKHSDNNKDKALHCVKKK